MLRVAVAIDKFPDPTVKANESMTYLERFKLRLTLSAFILGIGLVTDLELEWHA